MIQVLWLLWIFSIYLRHLIQLVFFSSKFELKGELYVVCFVVAMQFNLEAINIEGIESLYMLEVELIKHNVTSFT